jgi:hypothetical protein
VRLLKRHGVGEGTSGQMCCQDTYTQNRNAIGSSNKDSSSFCQVTRSCSPSTITLAAMASEGKEKKRKGTVVPQTEAHLQIY